MKRLQLLITALICAFAFIVVQPQYSGTSPPGYTVQAQQVIDINMPVADQVNYAYNVVTSEVSYIDTSPGNMDTSPGYASVKTQTFKGDASTDLYNLPDIRQLTYGSGEIDSYLNYSSDKTIAFISSVENSNHSFANRCRAVMQA